MNRLRETIFCICLVFVCFAVNVQAEDNGMYPMDIILNLIPGFGLGSFITGDILTGSACAAGELAGIGLILLPNILLKPPIDIPNGYTTEDPMYETYSYYSNRSMIFRVTGASVFALSKISGTLAATARHYGYSYDATYLSYILPCFGVGAFLNLDLPGGLIMLAADSVMAGQACIGVTGADINFIYGSLFLGVLTGTFGALRYFEDTYNLNLCLPIVLNLVPGFGIGSFSQGDVGFGIISLVADAVGLGLAGFGYLSMMGASSAMGAMARLGGIFPLYSGIAIYTADKVFGILRAIDYGFQTGGKQVNRSDTKPVQTEGSQMAEKNLFDGIELRPFVSILPAGIDRFGITMGVNIRH